LQFDTKPCVWDQWEAVNRQSVSKEHLLSAVPPRADAWRGRARAELLQHGICNATSCCSAILEILGSHIFVIIRLSRLFLRKGGRDCFPRFL